MIYPLIQGPRLALESLDHRAQGIGRIANFIHQAFSVLDCCDGRLVLGVKLLGKEYPESNCLQLFYLASDVDLEVIAPFDHLLNHTE